MLPFTKIPFLDAPPIPPKNPRGIDITNAHGHETTKNVSALYSQFVNSPNLRINEYKARLCQCKKKWKYN